ncbi:hypothetical protein C8A01DRAFT_40359 [Parachaetomium inaequale]|uniref:Uncharacterized protein n=1 Tax=Parachaetomium inaequale TaxID=2588326 RepID=A0AAN6P9E7_9PEZI|nr:hypothetical protein C8A01DRAFT_40359 [Parachaetomium inaequale]
MSEALHGPSLVLLDDSGMYPKNTGIGSIICSPSNDFIHFHRSTPPQPNFSDGILLKLKLSEGIARQTDANQLSFFLELALLEEANGVPSLDFETTKAAHLDKLVAELTECGEMPFALAPRFVHEVVTAEKLERMWRARFKVD